MSESYEDKLVIEKNNKNTKLLLDKGTKLFLYETMNAFQLLMKKEMLNS